MKKVLPYSISLLVFFFNYTFAQDLPYARKVIDTLTSEMMYGRGYVASSILENEAARIFSSGITFDGKKDGGLQYAGTYISTEFKNIGLKKFEGTEGYYQSFEHPVNTFPGAAFIDIDGKTLMPGKDFLVLPDSKEFHNNLELAWLTDSIINNKKARKKFLLQDFSNKILVIDTLSESKSKKISAVSLIKKLKNPPEIFIYTNEKKLTWGASTFQNSITRIVIQKNSIRKNSKIATINIDNQFIKDFPSKNIVGYIEGKEKPDSFVVFSAHYDHLGAMGDAFFPGANDNASGIAMLLNLAKYYSANPPKYSVAFIAFAGEELGLLGSNFFVDHPLFPLSKIKFLVNMDIVGTGDEGITVVNGSVYKEAFNLLTNINDEKKYLKQIKSRGKAMNSDHYFFSEKGVPSFFIYTMGGISAYHDIYDRAETLPLTEFEDLFRLLIDFENDL